MKNERIVLLLLLSTAVLSLMAGIALLNGLLIALCAVAVTISVLAIKSWYVVEALIFSRSGIVEICGGYELSGSREAAVKREGYNFSATAAALLEGAANTVDQGSIEQMIAGVSFPFRFVMHVRSVSAEKVLNTIGTKRAIKELELGRLAGSTRFEAKRAALKREIEALNRDIEAVSSSAPKELVRYIATTAIAQNRIAAEEAAKRQIRELTSYFSALTGASARGLAGAELIEAISLSS
ncbi:MAG: hypothetical protein ACP5UH_00860 [Candidatus Micrarchaeia archaeon]